jgi:hypothetical protein
MNATTRVAIIDALVTTIPTKEVTRASFGDYTIIGAVMFIS